MTFHLVIKSTNVWVKGEMALVEEDTCVLINATISVDFRLKIPNNITIYTKRITLDSFMGVKMYNYSASFNFIFFCKKDFSVSFYCECYVLIWFSMDIMHTVWTIDSIVKLVYNR